MLSDVKAKRPLNGVATEGLHAQYIRESDKHSPYFHVVFYSMGRVFVTSRMLIDGKSRIDKRLNRVNGADGWRVSAPLTHKLCAIGAGVYSAWGGNG